LTLGVGKDLSVTLVADDEYNDRFFILVGSRNEPTVRFVIAGDDVFHILTALRSVREDIEVDS
jgi:hypothetical protein